MIATWSNTRPRGGRPLRRRGYSLLEVILASAICASALVPALAILRDSLLAAETIDTRHMLLLYGVRTMEEQLAIVATGWTQGSASGDFASDGHANVRYSVTRSDDAGSGGITNRLMAISATAYYDDNGDDTLDAAEPQITFTTKISKLITYESLAGS